MNREDTLQVGRALGLQASGTNGEWLNYHCPFAPWYHKHGNDSGASFALKVGGAETSSYTCHGCHQSGTLTGLVQKLGQLRGHIDHQLLHATRMTELGAALNVDFKPFDRSYEEPEPELQPLNEAIYDGLFPSAWDVPESRAYLVSRGIGQGTADGLGLLYRYSYIRDNKSGHGTHEWVREDILFPVRDSAGALYGWSGRSTLPNTEPKIFDENLPKRHLILGEHRWREGYPKLIVEGLFGFAHLIEIGAEQFYDVGALMGSKMTEEKAAILKNWGNAVILLADNDAAGDACLFGPINRQTGNHDSPEKGAIHMLYGSVVLIVPEWPEGKDDPDQLTIEEVEALAYTPPYVQPKPQRKR